jgi:hypothetical protein
LFWLSTFIIGLPSIIKADIVIMADRDTLLPEFALVAKRQPLELSTPLQSFCFPSGEYARMPCSVCFAINIGAHKPPSRRTSVQALGTTLALTLYVEMMRGCWWGRGNASRIHCPSVAPRRCCIGPVATLAFRRRRSRGRVLE